MTGRLPAVGSIIGGRDSDRGVVAAWDVVASRREFRGVVDSLVAQFVSRNNDVDGYWALGLLAAEMGNEELTLDLLSPQPCESVLGRGQAARFGARLVRHLRQRSMPQAWLACARLVLTYRRDPAELTGGFRAVALVGDDRSSLWESARTVAVWPHDASREVRCATNGRNRVL